MKRRDFISLLGAAAAMPVASHAQERTRRLGAFTGTTADDADTRDRRVAFLQTLGQLGWTEGRNLIVEVRGSSGDAETMRRGAAELVAWKPDVILAQGGSAVSALLQQTSSVPVVFTIVPDPIGSGFVKSLSRPGGNATGFMQFEYGLTGKWVEMLKQLAPNVTRAAVLWDPSVPAGIGQFAVVQSVAPALGVDVFPIDLRNIAEAERSIIELALQPNGGMIVTAGPLGSIHRNLIVKLAVQHRLPAVYSNRYYVDLGGLASYGADLADQFRRAASYVDRVLKGEKPGDLPVQAPTKYELAINLKTARALGITVPPSVLTRADVVIE